MRSLSFSLKHTFGYMKNINNNSLYFYLNNIHAANRIEQQKDLSDFQKI